MQGWRKNMEDSKITELNVNINNKRYCVFGVFDGHGGTGFVMQEWRYPNL
jgi:serine/threonine protein phosphatase PrpC